MKTVLIVEDEANVRKFAAVNLAARGYDVVEVDNARDGLERLRRDQPDLLILDIRMPGGMSGLDLLDIMAEEQAISDIPVIVMTASDGAVEGVLEADFPHVARVLLKPASAPKLVEAVAKTLAKG